MMDLSIVERILLIKLKLNLLKNQEMCLINTKLRCLLINLFLHILWRFQRIFLILWNKGMLCRIGGQHKTKSKIPLELIYIFVPFGKRTLHFEQFRCFRTNKLFQCLKKVVHLVPKVFVQSSQKEYLRFGMNMCNLFFKFVVYIKWQILLVLIVYL